jgi:hypothetical protein
MPSTDPRSVEPRFPAGTKRPWVAPKLEVFGSIRELTRGAGSNNFFDGEHPPGQNKSRI